jgi:uncharacterized protein (TIGR02594 family)
MATYSTIQIQKALIAKGYDLKADNDPGPKTIAALRAFQKVAGLVPDGIAGPVTLKALFAKDAPASQPAPAGDPPWLKLARAELGTMEHPGARNNPKVAAYFRDAGFPGIKTDSTAWCAGFAGAILHRAGIKPSGSLMARSYEAWGVRLKEPVLGCIATKKRAGRWQGHVGFVVAANKTKVFLLAGNQRNRVSIASFLRREITEYRWPSSVAIPKNAALPTAVAGAGHNPSQA